MYHGAHQGGFWMVLGKQRGRLLLLTLMLALFLSGSGSDAITFMGGMALAQEVSGDVEEAVAEPSKGGHVDPFSFIMLEFGLLITFAMVGPLVRRATESGSGPRGIGDRCCSRKRRILARPASLHPRHEPRQRWQFVRTGMGYRSIDGRSGSSRVFRSGDGRRRRPVGNYWVFSADPKEAGWS